MHVADNMSFLPTPAEITQQTNERSVQCRSASVALGDLDLTSQNQREYGLMSSRKADERVHGPSFFSRGAVLSHGSVHVRLRTRLSKLYTLPSIEP